jgi:hypothetical protein
LISFPGTIVFQNGKRKDAEVGPLDKPSAKRVERVSENTSVSFWVSFVSYILIFL